MEDELNETPELSEVSECPSESLHLPCCIKTTLDDAPKFLTVRSPSASSAMVDGKCLKGMNERAREKARENK